MADIDHASPLPEPNPAGSDVPAPSFASEARGSDGASPPPDKPSHRLLDLVVLVALLALCAGVYRVVGDAGFSVIITAVAGLYGTWRMRQ